MTNLGRLTVGLTRLVAALAAVLALAALLVGVPWGLVTFIGWPLPDHIPTRDEIEATLLNPLSVTLLLKILACIAWPTWLVFTVDVARCVPDALRGVRPPAIGPVHAVAGVLVASAVLGLLPPHFPAASATPPPEPTLVAPQTAQSASPNPDGHHSTPRAITSRQDNTVVVRPPHQGVYDSLWRIAARALDDGRRWIEIFRLNRGRPQPDGGALTDPHLIRPGWVLRLPKDSTARPDSPPRLESALPHRAPSSQSVQPAPEVTQDQDHAPAPSAVTTTSGSALTLWSGGLVAATLASAVALAMVIRRRKRMRAYQPGSGDRTPPPPPTPAVHALRLAYDADHLDDTEPGAPMPVEIDLDGGTVDIGVHDERVRAIDVAAVNGLGLTGPGAEAAARALVVHVLASTRATVVVPAADARALVGEDLPATGRLHVTEDLPSAAAALAQHVPPDAPAQDSTELHAVLVARIERPEQRLQSILDAGIGGGIGAILLGHWPAGATVRVHADGIVAAASPAVDDLRDTRLFHMDAADTRDLVALLADTPAPRAPASSSTEPGDDELGTDAGGPGNTTHPEAIQPSSDSPEADSVDTEDPSHRLPADPADDGTHRAPTPDVAMLVDTIERIRQPRNHPWALSIFGPVTLTWYSPNDEGHDVTSALAPKHKALLVFLALHPSGTTRDAVREALWPDARGRRPFNAFYASLSQMRKAFATATDDQAADPISQHDEHVALDPDIIEVDYWQLHEAEHERRTAATDEDRLAAWSRIAAVYRGEIADGMSALWLEGPREAAHRCVVDALAGMAAHYRGRDPHRQLQLLEHARLLNPENEDIYRDIMRVQAELGFTDAIARTVQLLTTSLAEIGERPDPSTLTLARALQERQHRMAG
ncbi:hypothetical protein [Haloechinothrix salitolerans]|uniref:Bacterial transcriptional activator domain-containing protein n=1 Tax=Haloechinothrix salitolerans TaxID=926830 RepID=A0ABW2BVC1_9PSEU